MINYDIKVKVAAVQSEPVWFDPTATVDKAIRIIQEAAANGAKLVGFPELYVSGYPWWVQVYSPVTTGNRFYKKLYASTMQFGDANMKKLMHAARENHIYVVMGYSELSGGSCYMSQVFISDTGEILANRRKLKPSYAERMLYGEGDGSDMLVVDTPIGRIGGLNCWEHYQPLEKYVMAALHEQIHIASWPSHNVYQPSFPDTIESNKMATIVYACETQTFVIASTTLIGKAGQDAWKLSDELREKLPCGGGWASIYAPDGTELTTEQAIPEDQEGIVYADIDLTDIEYCKINRDAVGQYSRPDIFTLQVNASRNHHVVISGDPREELRNSLGAVNAEFLCECEKSEKNINVKQ